MVNDLILGGLPEREFLKEIETLLRLGRADEAADRLKRLLGGLCGPGRPLPARFLTVSPGDVELDGWNDLPRQIATYDKRGKNITAIGIDFSWPGHRRLTPDANGRLDPLIETNFFTDDMWPFSTCDRAGLLAGYTPSRCKWQGGFEEIDDTVEVKGIADLYGAVFDAPADRSTHTVEQRQAIALGACYVAVLVHLAVRDCAPRSILPRPMAVIVGSNEDYPLFNAPVYAAM